MKEFQLDIDRAFKKTNQHRGEKISHTVPQGGRGVKHVDETVSPTQAIIQLRVLMWRLLDGEHSSLNEEQVTSVLEIVKETPYTRTDLILSAERLFPILTSDLALLLGEFNDQIMNSHYSCICMFELLHF